MGPIPHKQTIGKRETEKEKENGTLIKRPRRSSERRRWKLG